LDPEEVAELVVGVGPSIERVSVLLEDDFRQGEDKLSHCQQCRGKPGRNAALGKWLALVLEGVEAG